MLKAILEHIKLSRRDMNENIEIYLQKYNKTRSSKAKKLSGSAKHLNTHLNE